MALASILLSTSTLLFFALPMKSCPSIIKTRVSGTSFEALSILGDAVSLPTNKGCRTSMTPGASSGLAANETCSVLPGVASSGTMNMACPLASVEMVAPLKLSSTEDSGFPYLSKPLQLEIYLLWLYQDRQDWRQGLAASL